MWTTAPESIYDCVLIMIAKEFLFLYQFTCQSKNEVEIKTKTSVGILLLFIFHPIWNYIVMCFPWLREQQKEKLKIEWSEAKA